MPAIGETPISTAPSVPMTAPAPSMAASTAPVPSVTASVPMPVGARTATTAAPRPLPVPVEHGPAFYVLVGGVFVVLAVGIVAAVVTVRRMRRELGPGGGSDEVLDIQNWPGLDEPDAEPDTDLSTVPGAARILAAPTAQPGAVDMPFPGRPPSGPRPPATPATPFEMPAAVAAPEGAPTPRQEFVAGPPAPEIDDDDPINRLLRDLESRAPSTPPTPAAEMAPAEVARVSTEPGAVLDVPAPASAVPLTSPPAGGGPMPFMVSPVPGLPPFQPTAHDTASPRAAHPSSPPPMGGVDISALLSPPPGAWAAVAGPEAEPEMPAPEEPTPAPPGPDMSDPLNKILAELEAAGPPPGYEAPVEEDVRPDIEGILSRAAPREAVPVAVGPVPPEVAAREVLSPADEDLLQFEELYAADPSNSSLLDYLATEYFDRGYVQRALATYGAIVDADEARADALQRMAECQIRLGFDEEAASAAARILHLQDADPEVRAWAEQLIEELHAEAVPPPVVTDPGTPAQDPSARALSDALGKAQILTVYGGSDATSIDSVKEQLDQDPDNPMLLDWYAFLLYSADRISESIAAYRRIVDEHKPTSNALYYLGNAYLKAFKYREAKQYWDRLIAEHPKGKLAAKAKEKLEKIHDLARRELENRTQAAAVPREARPASRGGGARRGRISPKRVEAAPAAPAPAPVVVPTPPTEEPLSAVGSLLDPSLLSHAAPAGTPAFTEYQQGDGSGAAEVEAMLAADPGNVELLDWAAFTNYTNKNYDRSLELYLKVLGKSTEYPQAYYYAGTILCRQERYDQAVRWWGQLLELYPDHKVSAKVRPKFEQVKRLLTVGGAAPVMTEPGERASRAVASTPVPKPAPAAPPPRGAQPASGPPSTSSASPADEPLSPVLAAFSEMFAAEAGAAPASGPLSSPSSPKPKLAPSRPAPPPPIPVAVPDTMSVEEVEALLERDGDNVRLLDWAAFQNLSAGKLDRAMVQYERAVELDPANPRIHYYLGITLVRLERFEEAAGYWRRLVERWPDEKVAQKARPRLEKLEAALGQRPAPAPVATAPAAAGAPTPEAAVDRLLVIETRDFDEEARCNAIVDLGVDRALLLDAVEGRLVSESDNVRLLDWGAWLAYSLGKSKRAIQLYTSVLKVSKDSPQAYYYVGVILKGQDRLDDAAKYWKVLKGKYGRHPLTALAGDAPRT